MSLREHYEDYWDRDKPSPIGDPLASVRLDLLTQHLERPDLELLDVGCGHGATLAELERVGLSVTGFDISERAISLARQRCRAGTKLIRHSVEDLPWPLVSESLDVVIAFELIEHLMHPASLVEGAHVALRSGGHLALTTPYHGRLKNVVVALLAFDHHFAQEGDHIRFFTDEALRRLLECRGFEVESMRHFGRMWPLWAGVFVWARKL